MENLSKSNYFLRSWSKHEWFEFTCRMQFQICSIALFQAGLKIICTQFHKEINLTCCFAWGKFLFPPHRFWKRFCFFKIEENGMMWTFRIFQPSSGRHWIWRDKQTSVENVDRKPASEKMLFLSKLLKRWMIPFIQLIPTYRTGTWPMETIGTLPLVLHLDHAATGVRIHPVQNISSRRASHWHVFPTKIPHEMRRSCQVLAPMIFHWKSHFGMGFHSRKTQCGHCTTNKTRNGSSFERHRPGATEEWWAMGDGMLQVFRMNCVHKTKSVNCWRKKGLYKTEPKPLTCKFEKLRFCTSSFLRILGGILCSHQETLTLPLIVKQFTMDGSTSSPVEKAHASLPQDAPEATTSSQPSSDVDGTKEVSGGMHDGHPFPQRWVPISCMRSSCETPPFVWFGAIFARFCRILQR